MTGRRPRAGLITGLWMLVMTSGCAPSDQTESAPSAGASPRVVQDEAVPAVVLPDLSSMEEWVQDEVRERDAVVQALLTRDPKPPDVELARAYGSLGLILMAAKQDDPAAASFLTAVALAPNDMRWPYYLGQIYLMTQDRAQAAEWFERVLELAPSDEATLVWLGRVYYDQTRFDAAARLFSHATLVEPRSAAAWAGVGQVALARQDYPRATESLEQALELDPGGSRVHYVLAMAYRSLGQLDKTAAHLERFNAQRFDRRRGGRWPLLADPLMLEYYDVLESAMVFEHRGNQALDEGDYPTAIEFFRRGIELEPDNPSLRQRLAAALVITGDRRGAADQLEEALRLSPEFALAHVGLAALLELEGHYQEAVERYFLALKYEPDFVEARLSLAEVLRARGRLEESLPHYAQVAVDVPDFVEAWVGRADALIRLERYSEAREWLVDARRVHPDYPRLQQLDEALAAMVRP